MRILDRNFDKNVVVLRVSAHVERTRNLLSFSWFAWMRLHRIVQGDL